MRNLAVDIKGFTLVELMVTVSIAGTLMAMAIPSFNSTIRSHHLTTSTNQFITSLNLARSEAIKRGTSVTVRKVDASSSTNLGASANWENGWDVFTDVNGNGSFDALTDSLIKTFPSIRNSYTLRGDSHFTDFIRFLSSGRSNNKGDFVICDASDGNTTPEANTSRLVMVNSVGRVRMGLDVNGDGIPNMDNVTNIPTCTP